MTTPRFTGWMTSAMTLAIGANAGQPLLTDDPGTPGHNRWEINVAATSRKQGDEWEFETPLLDLNYGIGDHLQLKYEMPWAVVYEKNEGARGGPGNSKVGIKWRFLDQEKAWLDVSTYPQFEFNHGTSSVDRGLAEAGWSVTLPIELAHQFGRLTVYSDIGYVRNERRPNEWFGGIAAEYEINDKFSVMGEFHGEVDHQFRRYELVSNLGFRWQLSRHSSLLMSAGRSIRPSNGDGPQFLSCLTLQFTF